MITGDSIVSAIATALSSGLGESVQRIYKNTPKEGTKLPYIFINSVLTGMRPQMVHYYMLDYTVDVIGHPKHNCDTVASWARDLSLNITKCLNYITVENLKCKCKRYEITLVDNVLHIICDYSIRVYLDEGMEDIYMQELRHNQRIKR